MRILLSGDGPTDYGCRMWAAEGWQEGRVQKYLRSIASSVDVDDLEIKAFDRKSEDIKHIRLQRRRMEDVRVSGHGVRARYLMAQAVNDGFDVAAFYVDSDNNDGEGSNTSAVRSGNHYQKLKDEVLQGMSPFDKSGVHKVAIIPVKTIESWLLADPEAFKVFEDDISDYDFPSNPELIWGNKNDPISNHPKVMLNNLLNRMGISADRQSYCEIAENSSLKEKCPISFKPFVGDFISCFNCQKG